MDSSSRHRLTTLNAPFSASPPARSRAPHSTSGSSSISRAAPAEITTRHITIVESSYLVRLRLLLILAAYACASPAPPVLAPPLAPPRREPAGSQLCLLVLCCDRSSGRAG